MEHSIVSLTNWFVAKTFVTFLMDQILNKLTIEKALCFLDDFCIVSDTFEKHMKSLHGLLQELDQSGLAFS